MSNVSVSIQITSIQTSQINNKPICDTRTRATMPGSIERLRVFKACQVDFIGSSLVSDENGNAVLQQVQMRSAPEGGYTFKFMLPNGIVSRPLTTYFATPAADVIIQNTPNLNAQYGVPFTIQPSVMVVDENNNPMANKKVVAISWTEYTLGATQAWQFNLQGKLINCLYILANKFALLEGDETALTGPNGIANFTNLTVIYYI